MIATAWPPQGDTLRLLCPLLRVSWRPRTTHKFTRRVLAIKIKAQLDLYAHLRAQYEDRQIYWGLRLRAQCQHSSCRVCQSSGCKATSCITSPALSVCQDSGCKAMSCVSFWMGWTKASSCSPAGTGAECVRLNCVAHAGSHIKVPAWRDIEPT